MPSEDVIRRPIEYAALLSYVSPKRWPKHPPDGKRRDLDTANRYTLALKNDHDQPGKNVPIYDYIAQTCAKQNLFPEFFSEETTLVPVPGSCLHKPDNMWPPELLANALKKCGLGREVVACLERVTPVPKSSQSKDRHPPAKHHSTMAVKTAITPPTNILLVDDVVTRGSIFLGSAWLLFEAYPGVEIKAFAAMRTCFPTEFKRLLCPCTGTIRLNKYGELWRSRCQEVPDHAQTHLFGE